MPLSATADHGPPVRDDLDGILNIHKPLGLTSHDVVARIRRISGQRRAGHAGTLDPAAEGVLLVCIGKATRVSEYLMAGRKGYLATIKLGISTTTDDAEGEVVRQSERVNVSRDGVESVLANLRGRISQVPPIYSALKVGGQPLYRLARAGIKVEPQAREVEIFELTLIDWQPPTLTLEIRCSPGTYVRALARDIGDQLGCGAHLSHLIRTASGHFTVDDAVTLEQLSEAFSSGRWQHLLRPLDEALLHLDTITVDAEGERLLTNGRYCHSFEAGKNPVDGELRRVYSRTGALLALAKYQAATSIWHPRKVFAKRDK